MINIITEDSYLMLLLKKKHSEVQIPKFKFIKSTDTIKGALNGNIEYTPEFKFENNDKTNYTKYVITSSYGQVIEDNINENIVKKIKFNSSELINNKLIEIKGWILDNNGNKVGEEDIMTVNLSVTQYVKVSSLDQDINGIYKITEYSDIINGYGCIYADKINESGVPDGNLGSISSTAYDSGPCHIDENGNIIYDDPDNPTSDLHGIAFNFNIYLIKDAYLYYPPHLTYTLNSGVVYNMLSMLNGEYEPSSDPNNKINISFEFVNGPEG